VPVNRTKKWIEPRGICFHYTGGPSGSKTAQWFNNPGCGNRESSAHVLIFDRITDDLIGRDWVELVPEEVRYFFPVPTLILADWSRAAWCSNWANGYCLGVENRNVGYNIAPRGKHTLAGKVAWVSHADQSYEPYTREQIIANISVGQLFKAIYSSFNPDFVLGHQGVWAEKSDPGPHFPMVHVRKAIMDGVIDFNGLTWLSLFPLAPQIPDARAPIGWCHSDDKRDSPLLDISLDGDVPGAYLDMDDPESSEVIDWLLGAFLSLGYHVSELTPERIRLFTSFFQRSTQAYADLPRKKDRVLRVDGIPGPLTRRVMFQRLIDLRVVVRMPPGGALK
jgi:N-acetyl-anhydromuramyl-L-alanine amidase AmpD